MLTLCPECNLQVSDKALTCPHCGYPLKGQPQATPRKKKSKRKRLPNGFGEIVEIKSKNLRKPYRASKSFGKKSNGRPIVKTIGYYKTYNDAYTALVEYNKNPYDIDTESITMQELFDQWHERYEKTVKSTKIVDAAWLYCSAIYDMRVKDLRIHHIKACIDHGTRLVHGKESSPSPTTKKEIKFMFNMLLDYAVEYEIIDKNYARAFSLSTEVQKDTKTTKKDHIPFSDEEMQILWDNLYKVDFVDIILIQCYSGWRPQEIGLIKIDRVDLDNWVFQGGMKTEAGIDRLVPIHSRIRPLVQKRYEEAISLGSKYLFNYTYANARKNSLAFTYPKYYNRLEAIKEELGLNPEHRPHDGRKHFITMAKKYGVDQYAIKYIVGHKIDDLTESVYTERDPEWLRKEIEKIK